MITITEISSNKFELNGIPYFKNFTPVVKGDKIMIVNTYDAKTVLAQLADYTEFRVDGNSYASVSLLQAALLPVIFTRDTLSSGGTGVWGTITGDINNQTDLISLVGSAGSSQTLQEVTDQGETTTNDITIEGELTVGDESDGLVRFNDNNSIEYDGELSVNAATSINLNSPSVFAKGNEVVTFADKWNAATNSPTLADTDTGKKSIEYEITGAATPVVVNFGSSDITVQNGDIISNSGTQYYKKVDNNQSGEEYQNTDNTNGRLRSYIIPANFDFENIPTDYNNAKWEIRHVHDLNAADFTIPNNVTINFTTGKFTNYGTITLDETKFDFSSTYPIFDGSGDFIGSPKMVQGFITPIHFGAVGDDTVDCTIAFNKVSEFVGTTKISGFNVGRPLLDDNLETSGAEIRVPTGMYKTTDEIIIRSGQVWKGIMSGTIIHFEPTVLGINCISIVNTDLDNNYLSNRNRHVYMDGFTLSGDIAFDGTGNAGTGLYLSGASHCNFENFTINKFEYGVSVNLDGTGYYNTFVNFDLQQNRQNAYVGQGTAVTSFENCVLVGRGEFTGKYDYNVVAHRDTYFTNCSFEGSSWPLGHLDAPEGGVNVDGRQEGAEFARINGRSVTGGMNINFASGIVNGYADFTNIDDAPLLADMGDDQSSFGQNFDFGQGSFQEVKMMTNQNWKFGMTDWEFDGNLSANGSIDFIEDRSELIGSSYGIKMTKINPTGVYSIFQPIKLNAPQFYMSVWVKQSSDAIIRIEMSQLYSRDNNVTPSFKDFSKIVSVGEWTLYAVKVSHYYKANPTLDPRPMLGLKNTSPTGSWVIFSNLRFSIGGHPLFTGSNDAKVDKIHVLSEKPTEGFLNLGDRIIYDGTDVNYPLNDSDPTGALCTFKLESTAFNARVAGNTNIIPTPSTGILAGDILGIYLDNGTIQWNVATSNLSGLVGLQDPLDDDVSTGNRIITYRLIDQYTGKSPIQSYTVATLPASPVLGDRAIVTDSGAVTYGGIVAGGGAVTISVLYDGTNWIYN